MNYLAVFLQGLVPALLGIGLYNLLMQANQRKPKPQTFYSLWCWAVTLLIILFHIDFYIYKSTFYNAFFYAAGAGLGYIVGIRITEKK